MWKFAIVAGFLVGAGSVAAEQAVQTETSGRFHIEVKGSGQDSLDFSVRLTPVVAEQPMEPVNQPMLHLSCLALPDLLAIASEEVFSSAQIGADRYCRAQFGDDQVGQIAASYEQTPEGAYLVSGACWQAPV